MAVENRVRELRAVIGKGEITQKLLAERAGIDPSTLSDIEKNRTGMSAATALSIARALGVTVEDLFLPASTDGLSANSPRTDRPGDGAAPSAANGASTPSSGEGPVATVSAPPSPGDRTAAEPVVAKESDGDLAGAR